MPPPEPRLRRNAVGLTGAVIMSAAIMGPAVSTFFNPQFSMPFSGEATPFVYLACTIALLIAASGIVEMAREFPSAGAFYTYVTRGLGPRAGFVTGGLMFVAYALLPPAEVGLIGSYLQSTFRTELDVNIPWWIIGLVPAALMVFLAFEGIRSSLRTIRAMRAKARRRRRAATVGSRSGAFPGSTPATLVPACKATTFGKRQC